MNRLNTRTVAAVVGAAALIVGGCATANAPTAQRSDASASRALPPSSPPEGFASPRNLLERYPEMKRQAL